MYMLRDRRDALHPNCCDGHASAAPSRRNRSASRWVSGRSCSVARLSTLVSLPSLSALPQAAVRDQKAEGHDIAERAASAAQMASEEEAETARLRAQIVESPEVCSPLHRTESRTSTPETASSQHACMYAVCECLLFAHRRS